MINQTPISYPNQKAAQLLIEGLGLCDKYLSIKVINSHLFHYANVCSFTGHHVKLTRGPLSEDVAFQYDGEEVLRYDGRLPTEDQLARAFQSIHEIAIGRRITTKKELTKNENRPLKPTDESSD